MEKEFVPYDLALKLKELGFDEKCFCNWEESWSPEPEDEIRMVLTTDQTWLRPGWIRAPTFSQAFRWFREKYHIIGEPKYKGGLTTKTSWYDYIIYSNIDWEEDNKQYKTYEEAELACLQKMVEIVENNLSN